MSPAIVSVPCTTLWECLCGQGRGREEFDGFKKGKQRHFFCLKMAHSTLRAEKNQMEFLEDQHFCQLLMEKDQKHYVVTAPHLHLHPSVQTP